MSEFRLGTLEKAEILVKLLQKEIENDDEDKKYPLLFYVDATKSYSTFEEASKYLNQPCLICEDEYPMDEVSLISIKQIFMDNLFY